MSSKPQTLLAGQHYNMGNMIKMVNNKKKGNNNTVHSHQISSHTSHFNNLTTHKYPEMHELDTISAPDPTHYPQVELFTIPPHIILQ